jgi:hypothetical protein
MSETVLFIGRHPHSIRGHKRTTSLTSDAVDRDAAFKSNTHAAKRAAWAAADRPTKTIGPGRQDRGRYRSAVRNLYLSVIDDECDQWFENVLEGE